VFRQNRPDLGFCKFLKWIGVANPDRVKIAGGAMCLVSPESETDRKFVLGQIPKSMYLHGTDGRPFGSDGQILKC
jgi:hypothetical protein